MLGEAIRIIRELHNGQLVTFRGDFFDVDSARIWDLPEGGVPSGVAAGGTTAVAELGPLADHLIATDPDRQLLDAWNSLKGRPRIGDGARAIGQIPVSWDPDPAAGGRPTG